MEERLAPFLSGLMKPTAQAQGLPGWIYADPAFFELERKKIFAPSWFGITYASDVPEVGDAVAADYAGWRFLVVRGQDQRVRVFHNMCRHRGLPLLEGERRGRKTIGCPWHMWTYDLTGRLVATPNISGTDAHICPGFDKDELGLLEVRSESWMGVIFVNVDGKAPPLASYLEPMCQRLEAFDLSLVRESDEKLETHFDGNWKLALEGGVEDYHIPWVHKGLGPSGDFRGEWHGETWVGVTCRRSMDVARRRFVDPSNKAEGKPLPMFPHLPESGTAEASIILSLLPATLIATITDHVVLSLFIPESPSRTRVRRRFHFIGDAATSAEHATARRRVRDSWSVVTDEDAPVIAVMQKQAPVRDELGFRPRFSPYWEPAVHHFQKVIASRMTGERLT